jgi:hypothetical protein
MVGPIIPPGTLMTLEEPDQYMLDHERRRSKTLDGAKDRKLTKCSVVVDVNNLAATPRQKS